MVEATVFKTAGSVLIIGATTLAGFFYSKRDALREEQLLEMKKALTIFKNEIRFQLTPFGEAAASVSERAVSPVAEIFAFAAENALSRNGNGAFEIWEKAVDSVEGCSYFSADDIQAFKSMGKNLGRLDKEMQSQSIDLLIDYIDSAVLAIRDKSAQESKMYKSLGFLSGLLIAVVLM